MESVFSSVNGGGEKVDYVINNRVDAYIDTETERRKIDDKYIGRYIHGEIIWDFVIDILTKARVFDINDKQKQVISMDLLESPKSLYAYITDVLRIDMPEPPTYNKFAYKIDENTIDIMNSVRDDAKKLERYYNTIFTKSCK